jgi:hypothetical protein
MIELALVIGVAVVYGWVLFTMFSTSAPRKKQDNPKVPSDPCSIAKVNDFIVAKQKWLSEYDQHMRKQQTKDATNDTRQTS